MEKNLEKIKTTRFGEVEVDNSLLFNFVSPIIGYNDKKSFILIDYRPDSPFKWLQSMEDMDLAFPVTLCSYFNIDYQFELSDEDAKTLGVKGATINLLAPIVINTNNNNAMQVILKDSKLPVRHPLFEKKENDGSKESEQ